MAQSAIQSWYRADGGAVSFSLGGEAISIERADVDRLVRSLRQSELAPAASICEEISARTLTGHVELCPTEAELEVLVSTLERLRPITDENGALRRLLVLGCALRALDETATAEIVPLSDGRKDET
jgi:hypothetical protein